MEDEPAGIVEAHPARQGPCRGHRGGISRLGLRRAIAGVAAVLSAAGIAMLAYTPATNLYAARAQSGLRQQFGAEMAAATAGPTGPVPERQALAVLRAPAIDLDAVVVQGTDPQALRTGPGHYVDTPLPCEAGNVGIAGHRTTYGHPFNHLDALVAGDRITVQTRAGSCTYEVDAPPPGTVPAEAGSAAWVISPYGWAVIDPLTGAYLTLTTCNPEGSAAQRLVARAHLIAAT